MFFEMVKSSSPIFRICFIFGKSLGNTTFSGFFRLLMASAYSLIRNILGRACVSVNEAIKMLEQ